MNACDDLKNRAKGAKAATFKMSMASTEQKNSVLEAMIKYLRQSRQTIYEANDRDIALAKADGLDKALIERLSLKNRLEGIIEDIGHIIRLPDPIGQTIEEKTLSNQLHLAKRRVPIGVLGVIYESRPNVTLDIGALTIKSGNCAILRGGSETFHTNGVLIDLIQKSLVEADLPAEAIQCIAHPDRTLVKELLRLNESVDLIIPRGSAALQTFCRENSTIPVITGGVGICHLFADETADRERSLPVISNAKVQRPTVCNALDTLLVHASIASRFIPEVVETLATKGVTFRLDPKAWDLIQHPSCSRAEPNNWDTEWLSLVLGIKVVENIQEAMDHIRRHSTGHSDGILTENSSNGDLFVNRIDSAAVYVNASTRFTDGGQFGLGAEVAISTQKVHARGPMGLDELTSYKWVVRGNYQTRN